MNWLFRGDVDRSDRASAALRVAKEDRLLLQWNGGQGVSRYFNDGLSGLATVYDAGGRLEPLRLIGA